MKTGQTKTLFYLLKLTILFSALTAFQVPRHLLTYDIPDVPTKTTEPAKITDTGTDDQTQKIGRIRGKKIKLFPPKTDKKDKESFGKTTGTQNDKKDDKKPKKPENIEMDCDINGVHLAPGKEFESLIDYDVQVDSAILYKVGFASQRKCDMKLMKLNLMVQNTVSLKVEPVTEREYIAPKDSGVDYHRYFYFFDIKMENVRASPCSFNYTISHDSTTSAQFNFSSQVFCKKAYRILTFGQSDDTIVGITTIDRLKYYPHDLLILTGNYVTGYHFDNGRLHERYFNAIEHLMASKVTLILPGRRESFDNFRMFQSRFMMPGCGEDINCDLYWFHDYDLQIFMMNIDRYLIYPELDMRAYLQKFRNLMETQLIQRKYRDGWKMVFTNTHFYCSDPAVYDNCIGNLYLLKEFEDVFEYFEINLVVSSSKMVYESVRNVYNFEVRQNNAVPRNYVLSGVAGCHNYLTEDEFDKMPQLSFSTEPIVRSIVTIDIFNHYYKMDLMEIPNFISRDLRFMSLKFEFLKMIGFLIFFALMAAVVLLFELTDSAKWAEKYAKHKINQKNARASRASVMKN